MIQKLIKPISIFYIFFFLIIMGLSNAVAYSFRFRELKKHSPIPDVTLYNSSDNSQKTFSSIKGQPFIVIFWGADLPAKLDRSIKTLKEIEEIKYFLDKRNIQSFSVNIQGDLPETMDRVISESKSSLPLYLDHDKKVYGTLGVFVMPSILLVDKDGNVAAGMGYSHDIIDRLRGAIEIMLGEKTEEQVLAELRPEMIEKSPEEKAAERHMNFALVMLERGMPDTAIREFEKALTLSPNRSEILANLCCLYLDKGLVDDAEKVLIKGLALDPDSLQGNTCNARLKFKKGMSGEAIEDLAELILKNPNNHRLHYLLGIIYQSEKQQTTAMSEFKKAYILLETHVEIDGFGCIDPSFLPPEMPAN